MTKPRSNISTRISAPHEVLRRLCQPAQVARLLYAAAQQHGIKIADFDDVHVERCWPGRDGTYLFEWSFTTDGARCRLYGRCYPDEADGDDVAERSTAARRNGEERGFLPTVTHDLHSWQPEWRTTVFSSDRDQGLPHLPACLSPEDAGAVARLVPRGSALLTAQLLAYKPGRRATIHYALRSRGKRAGGRHAAGKTFRDHRGQRLLELHRQVRSQLKGLRAALTAPAPLGYIKPLRLAVMEWIDVKIDARRLGAGDFVAALADLHRVEIADLPTHTIDNECAVIRQWHEHLQIMRPADADRVWPLVKALCERGAAMDAAPHCLIHRDFYDRQLLAGAKCPVLIDLDTLAWGDRCVDLGNLAAHLALSRLARGEHVRSAPLCREIAGLYEQAGHAVDRERLEYFAAASMFRVAAVHAVRTVTQRWARPLVQLAARLMSIELSPRLGALT